MISLSFLATPSFGLLSFFIFSLLSTLPFPAIAAFVYV